MSQSSEYWQDRCNELECDVADLRENLEFWKGECEAGVGRVQILEAENAKLKRDLADMTRLAMEYKDTNTRLESQLRELLAPRDEAYGRLRAAIRI